MATLAGPSSSPVSSPSFNRRRKSWARRIERCCCSTITHFPLAFVYGLTTWAIYVEVNVAFLDSGRWSACAKAVLGVLLYGLANASYTVAVFTNPGSPLDPRIDLSLSSTRGGKGGRVKSGYDVLPTHEDHASPAHHPSVPADMTLVTAKASNGSPRYCKKCHTLKPDRSHHCSTCGRCVLKMDHHCPWLATCVGLRNYKAFLLFLIYTSLYCWLCFGLTGSWVWAAVTDDSRMRQSWLIINNIMLAVLSGIIGLVLSGFTGWHIYLVCRGETTIESLEKTRYLSPLRKSMAPSQHRGDIPSVGDIEEGNGMQDQEMGLLDQLKETHANALPGILRPEEGESSHPPSSSQASPNPHPNASPAKASLQRSYAAMEVQRERDRYNAYLDEQDSEKLPNAFNLGWRRNLRHVFGQQALLWFLPVCNTSGDGWMWEVSPVWQEARAEQEREREARMREDRALRELDEQSLQAGRSQGRFEGPVQREFKWMGGQGFVDRAGHAYPQSNGHAAGGSHMPMQPLDRRKAPMMPRGHGDVDNYDSSSDEDSHWRNRPRKMT